ncbi:hypothetical protein TELCIR_24707, partial [Teladorsagia circumcincta]
KANFFSGLRMGGHRGSPYEAPENTIEGFAMSGMVVSYPMLPDSGQFTELVTWTCTLSRRY